MQGSKERFEHRRLESVVDPRPGSGIEADAHVGAERDGYRRDSLDARLRVRFLDPGEVRRIESCRCS
jgi:hypothetical protein